MSASQPNPADVRKDLFTRVLKGCRAQGASRDTVMRRAAEAVPMMLHETRGSG